MDLPRLGRIVALHGQLRETPVTHVRSVEVGDDFVVEGCRDGDFEALGFQQSRCFFRSGLRIVGESVLAVRSCALIHRLLVADLGATMAISNSLVLLLAALGATLDSDLDMRPISTYTVRFPG